MHLRFDGRIALVTGVAQGIGQAIAAALKDAGAAVHGADLDAECLDRARAKLGIAAHVLDVSDRTAAHALIEDIVGGHRRLDI
ncbi:MAG: SDR family NAD(P)-dependent oxidoreductase, partial [Hyphomicrobiaceae bacterium]